MAPDDQAKPPRSRTDVHAAEAAGSADAVAGVMVTFNPPDGLAQRLRAVLREIGTLVIVDNGSSAPLDLGALTAHERARVHLVEGGTNAGLAAALNRGIDIAAGLGAGTALLLDHDSVPSPGMVRCLRDAGARHARPDAVAAIVPAISYAHPDIRCRWPKSGDGRTLRFRFAFAAQLTAPTTVDLAIGSGMLIDIGIWRRVGRFDEHLFIDLVDTDFCLRARRLGFDILAAPDAVLKHELGDVEKRMLLGVVPTYPTNHGPMRHYYLSRNRVLLAKRHAARFPSWFIYEMLSAAKLTAKVALFEARRGEKLMSMCRGTWAGLRASPAGLGRGT